MSVGRDTGFNLVAALAPVLFTLTATPIYLHAIGPERFGILAICWTIVGALGFAALGMGPAVGYRLALMDNDAPADRSRQLWSALLISIPASLLGSLLVLAIAHLYFQRFASLPTGLRAELWRALPMLAILLPLGTAYGVLAGALQGRKRFGALSAMGVLSAAAATGGPLIAALLVGTELPVLVLAMVVGSALVLLLQLGVGIRVVPVHSPPRFRSEDLRALLRYGAWMSGTALVAPIVLLIDRFIIGSLRGPAEVTVYVLAFQLVQGMLLIPASLGSAMLPRLAPLTREEDVRRIQSDSLGWLNGRLTVAVIGAVSFSTPFFRLWVGPTLGSSAGPVAAVLLVGCWAHGIGHIPASVVVGRSRPDLLTKLLLTCLVPYLLLLYLATERFGVMGAAAAWTVRAAFDPILFLYTRPRGSDMRPLIVSGALVLCAMATALALSWTSALYWFIFALIIAVACGQHRAVLISFVGDFRSAWRGVVRA